MWNNALVPLSNEIDDISQSLEREFILRRFNKDCLKMETPTGSDINKIVGVGNRTDSQGKTDKVTKFYPSHHREILMMFEYYPIKDYFGINVKDAMSLPIDEWYSIRKTMERIGPKQPDDSKVESKETLSLLVEIVKLLQGQLINRGEGS